MNLGLGSELGILAVTAGSIGFVHTVTGPDHYLPFIVVGRARSWSLARALGVTAICGVGHVVWSVVLGLVGIGLGLAVGRLEVIEGVRGDIAAWLLISFGLVYTIWGLRQALRWLSDEGRHDAAAIDEASRRFDLSPLEEEFLLRNLKRKDHEQ